jgi:YebC/PmpR family DNA-binding regulatory protein
VSGHSKWSTIKHKKGKEDAKRGQLFSKLARAIMVAAKEGGPDPESNAALAAAVEKARSYSMPKDNIDRAIERGSGGAGSESFEAILYEGYGPSGVAIIVEALTDNRNRSAAYVRSVFTKHNGSLGGPGSVAWIFERRGSITVDGTRFGEDAVMDAAIEGGADDVTVDGDTIEVITEPGQLSAVRQALEAAGIETEQVELTMVPKSTVKLEESDARKMLKLVDALEGSDDVQEVYANFDISDEVLEAVAG